MGGAVNINNQFYSQAEDRGRDDARGHDGLRGRGGLDEGRITEGQPCEAPYIHKHVYNHLEAKYSQHTVFVRACVSGGYDDLFLANIYFHFSRV